MEPVALFLLVILLGVIVLFVTRPFFKRRKVQAREGNREISSLLAERERLLTALEELDFDQSLGKIPAEDYPTQRALLLQKGAEVLRQLDTLETETKSRSERINQSHIASPKPVTPLSDDDLDDLLAKRRNIRKDKTAGFCPKCGKPVLKSDAFCPSCGNTLKSE
ncbi:MAG: zinc ribbon domain-containing protein [Anaerolineales bacterium]